MQCVQATPTSHSPPPLPFKAVMWLDQLQIEAIICNMQQWNVFTFFLASGREHMQAHRKGC